MSSPLCSIVLLLIAIVQGHPSECSWTNNTYGVAFNYYALKLTAGGQLNYYTTEDKVPDQPKDPFTYTYYFNLCGPVLDYPERGKNVNNTNVCLIADSSTEESKHYSYCDSDKINRSAIPNKCSQSADERLPINGEAYAYQLRSDNKRCFPLSGLPTKDNKQYTISLYDDIDPTQGITIQYHNGAWSNDCGANRELTVHLKCEDNPDAIPAQSDVVEYGATTCKYALTIKSIHGCPSGCGVFANSLCAAQGLCGYDFSSNRSRCFCYWGYTGSSCEQVIPGTFPWKPAKPAPDTKKGEWIHTFPTPISFTNPITGEVTPVTVNTTYDLTDAHNPDSIYQINDTAQAEVNTKEDYRFYFNIGGTINSGKLPSACHKVTLPCVVGKNFSTCNNEYNQNISLKSPAEIGYAFRLTNNTIKSKNNKCIMLGSEKNKTWIKYDNTDNPAHGVQITFIDGSFSQEYSSSEIIVNCKFTINLICPTTRKTYRKPKSGMVIDQSEVTDLGSCHYKADFETAFACPYHCLNENSKTSTFSVCNGHGKCIADPVAGFTRCVCDEMYRGDDCGTKVATPSGSPSSKPHSDAGFNVAIVIISLLLIGFVIAVIYLWRRNKTLEKYAVPILDEHEQVEPTVPDYSDSDSDHFRRSKIGGSKQEMMTIKTNIDNNNNKSSFRDKLFGGKKKQKKFKKQGKNKYQAQSLDISDDDDDDDSDQNNGPSAYLAANQDDDSDTD